MIENLPYTLMKLKKLKALWLSENQAKPLIPLQMDWDEANEKRYLTCYMFPQRPIEIYDEAQSVEDNRESINQSLMEEEWKKRTSVVFDLDDDDPQVVRLSRQPTPFPKDIRDKINQFRTQSIAKGHVSNNHSVGEHVVPQHPYAPADEIETKLHGHGKSALNGHHEPYAGHQNAPQQHMTEEEKMLLEQLQNTSLGGAGSGPHNDAPSVPVAPRTNHVNFSVPIIPSPISGRRYPDDEENNSMENIHLSVGDTKKQIKLSSDSGLGSSEMGDDHQQWKNEYPAIPEEGEVFRVTIKKTPNLGFSVSGGKDAPGNPFRPGDTGIFITRVIPDGPAADVLQPGDKLLEVNGNDFRCVQHETAVNVLKASQEVHLVVARRASNNEQT
eukprot:TCONS_00029743-protein